MSVTTPTGISVPGVTIDLNQMVGISIIRAGDSMLGSFMEVAPEATVGKILIQRDEATCEPVLFYSKLPPLEGKTIMLLDPMLATGGSAKCAVKVLLEKGASEENIMFVNVLACPEGIKALQSTYPGKLYIVSSVAYIYLLL